MTNVRVWTDRSGTFKVEAEYINVADNKVHLHKVNGVKIAVPLDKLDPKDLEYVARMPGNEALLSRVAAPVPVPPRPRNPSKVDEAVLAAAASIRPSEPLATTFIYNGFNWKEWLINTGVSPGDAIAYGQKFAAEKMDGSCLSSLQRELLRALGVSEGDIIRIRKAALEGAMPEVSSQVLAAAAAKEKEAQERNLAMINRVSIFMMYTTHIFQAAKSNIPSRSDQIRSDEEFARQLQMQELNNSAQGDPRGAAKRNFLLLDIKLTINSQTNIIKCRQRCKLTGHPTG